MAPNRDPVSIRDAILAKGWRPEWFNETGTIVRFSSRAGQPCFEPFFWKHRLFHRDRYLVIRNLLGADGTLIRFSSTLSRDESFLGNIDSNEPSEVLTTAFPWDRFVRLRFEGYPTSRLDVNHYYFHVLDEQADRDWKVATVALTWIREVSVRFPREHAT